MSKPKLLLIEDQFEIIECLMRFTSKWDVTIAQDFKTALNHMHREPFDLIVTDFNFPGGDGLVVVKCARSMLQPKVFLHSSSLEYLDSSQKKLFDRCFTKYDKELLTLLREAA